MDVDALRSRLSQWIQTLRDELVVHWRSLTILMCALMIVGSAMVLSPFLVSSGDNVVLGEAVESASPEEPDAYAVESELHIESNELGSVLYYHDTVRHEPGVAGRVTLNGGDDERATGGQTVLGDQYVDLSGETPTSFVKQTGTNWGDLPPNALGNCTSVAGDDTATGYSMNADAGADAYQVPSRDTGADALDMLLDFDIETRGDETVFTPTEGVYETDGFLIRATDTSGSVTVVDGRIATADISAEVAVRTLVSDDQLFVPGLSEKDTWTVDYSVDRTDGNVTVAEPAWLDEARDCFDDAE